MSPDESRRALSGRVEMHTTCRQWIESILNERRSLVALAVRQRAKFEGWLKFELAARIEEVGAQCVRVEAGLDSDSKRRADIIFCFDDVRYDLELKTPNTSLRGMPGIENKTRPITMNIASIVEDARKLKDTHNQGLVAFVLFPVPQDDTENPAKYLQRIGEQLSIPWLDEDCCTRVPIPIRGHGCCDVVVCCFPYP